MFTPTKPPGSANALIPGSAIAKNSKSQGLSGRAATSRCPRSFR